MWAPPPHKFEYEAVQEGKPGGAIRIKGDWEKTYITEVLIDAGPRCLNGRLHTRPFHKLAVRQLQALWADWGKAGLLDRVLFCGGFFVPRFIRGRTDKLSNHAFGTAFDINVAWNGLGQVPALVGQEGCVRELVPIANRHGFYWGGHYHDRLDGMHFEMATPP
jgi:hypothetical protein